MTSHPAWRVEPVAVDDPEALVAATLHALAALADDGVPRLRWYRSPETAVVRGRGQRDRDLAGAGVRVLDRPTGGGAVLLDPHLLSCDVLVPADHPLAAGAPVPAGGSAPAASGATAGDPLATFDRVGAAWRDALAALGVGGLTVHPGPSTVTRRGDPRQRLLADVCLATRGRGEVLLDGRKLVGLSQRRRRSGVLVQCGLLRRWEPGRLLAALGGDPRDAQIAESAVGLDEAVSDPPDDAAVADAVSARLAGWHRAGVAGAIDPVDPAAGVEDEP